MTRSAESSPPRKSLGDLWIAAAALLVATIVLSLPSLPPPVLRTPLTLLLTVGLPGYALGAAVMPRVPVVERLTLTLAFGLIAPVLIGLTLHILGVRMAREMWVIVMAVTTAGALVSAAVRRPGLRAKRQRGAPSSDRTWAIAIFAASVLVVMAAFGLRLGAAPQPGTAFTQLWIGEGRVDSTIEVGIRNHELTVETYRLEVAVDGQQRESLITTLADGEQWAHTLAVDRSNGTRVDAALYLVSSNASPYRSVSLTLPAAP